MCITCFRAGRIKTLYNKYTFYKNYRSYNKYLFFNISAKTVRTSLYSQYVFKFCPYIEAEAFLNQNLPIL